ncbi:MAG: hypothetical protein ACK4RK_14180 [Gemmataceae bacterium]
MMRLSRSWSLLSTALVGLSCTLAQAQTSNSRADPAIRPAAHGWGGKKYLMPCPPCPPCDLPPCPLPITEERLPETRPAPTRPEPTRPETEPPADTTQAPQTDLTPETGTALGGEGFAAADNAPFMIGDSTGGGCGAAAFNGIVGAVIEHPTFACSRLNIAENNSPMPRDRIYFTYQHFHNISPTDVLGFRKNHSINRYTFGVEKTALDGWMSAEVRIPINEALSSNLLITQVQGVNNLPIDQRATEIGNVSAIGKLLLYRSPTFNVSTGVGVNLPTARDVDIRVRIEDDQFPLNPNQTIPLDLDFRGVIRNSTVNVSPFLGALWTPNPCFFSQGFLQIDCPVNRSKAFLDRTLDDTFITPLGQFRRDLGRLEGQVTQQTLLRLSAGAGYWVCRNPCAKCLTGLAPILEVHYTTTLDNAAILEAPVLGSRDILDSQLPSGIPETTLRIGNLANHVDVVNLTMGATIELFNRMTLTPAFVVPLSGGDNKPFDYEAHLQLNWRFGPVSPAYGPAYAAQF